MTPKQKENAAAEIVRIMDQKGIGAYDLAPALRVTAQTVYNIRKGAASAHLLEFTLRVLDKWEG